jgi:hypothetical protein
MPVRVPAAIILMPIHRGGIVASMEGHVPIDTPDSGAA